MMRRGFGAGWLRDAYPYFAMRHVLAHVRGQAWKARFQTLLVALRIRHNTVGNR